MNRIEHEGRDEKLHIHKITRDELSLFLKSNPDKVSAFNRPEIKETMAEIYGMKLANIGISTEGQLQGVGQFFIQRKGPLGIVQAVPTRYTGPVVAHEILPQTLVKIKDYLSHHGIGKLLTDFPPSVHFDTTQIKEVGYVVKPMTSRIMDLRKDDLLQSADQGMRRGIRKTLSDPRIEVSQPSEAEFLLLEKFLAESYKNQGKNQPYPPNMSRIIWDKHHDDPLVHMSLVSFDNQPIGMMVSAFGYDQTACSWMIGVDHTAIDTLGINYPVSGVLIKDAAEWAKDQGAQYLDLGEGPEKVAEFKRRMGAVQVPYIAVEYTHPLYRPFFEGRSSFKRLTGK